MAQYMLAIHMASHIPDLPVEELRQSQADIEALNAKMTGAGAFLFGTGLEPVETAAVVRQSGTDFVTTDGPYLETKEHIGGFWIIEAQDRAEALSWARQATAACRAPVELRRCMTEPPEIP